MILGVGKLTRRVNGEKSLSWCFANFGNKDEASPTGSLVDRVGPRLVNYLVRWRALFGRQKVTGIERIWLTSFGASPQTSDAPVCLYAPCHCVEGEPDCIVHQTRSREMCNRGTAKMLSHTLLRSVELRIHLSPDRIFISQKPLSPWKVTIIGCR